MPAPVFYQHLVLKRGRQPNWAAARRAIANLDYDDVEYLDFALGLTVEDEPDPDRLLAEARAILEADLDRLRSCLCDPIRHGIDRIITPAAGIYTVAGYPDGDNDGIYGTVLRLGLMYVTDAAGFGRHSLNDATGPAHPVRCVSPRRRARTNPIAFRHC